MTGDCHGYVKFHRFGFWTAEVRWDGTVTVWAAFFETLGEAVDAALSEVRARSTYHTCPVMASRPWRVDLDRPCQACVGA